MKSLVLSLALVGALAPAASASLVVFSGSGPSDGPDGNTRIFVSDGVTVSVSAKSALGGTAPWVDSYLGLYGNGLGVTNPNEGSGHSGMHAIDNSGSIDMILFNFSAPVVFDRVYLSALGDTDLSLSYRQGGSWNFLENNYGSDDSRWANVNSGNVVSRSWALSALKPANGYSDSFKVKKVRFQQVRPPRNKVPDGGSSVALLGLGFVSLVSARSLRKKA